MPLLDHFHPPLSARRHWEGIHNAWANAIVHRLNHGLLPPRFFAEPNIHLGIQVESDVATFQERVRAYGADGGVATEVWAPPRPAIALPVTFSNPEIFEVQVFNDEEGPRLVAAVELVSPGNKDRPSNRRAFAVKCASYLQQGIGVVVVDVVTTRQASLHEELLELIELSAASKELLSQLYAVAYRTVVFAGEIRLEAWPEGLALGESLPGLPLWIKPDLAVPLDLEQTYGAACATLLISD